MSDNSFNVSLLSTFLTLTKYLLYNYSLYNRFILIVHVSATAAFIVWIYLFHVLVKPLRVFVLIFLLLLLLFSVLYFIFADAEI